MRGRLAQASSGSLRALQTVGGAVGSLQDEERAPQGALSCPPCFFLCVPLGVQVPGSFGKASAHWLCFNHFKGSMSNGMEYLEPL